jgi:enamine deaminase RidA (YjgF/YER057c/UK114 family)
MKRFLKSGKTSAPSAEQTQGLAHGTAFKRLVVASQLGTDAAGAVPKGLEAQCELAFDNLLAVIESAQLRAGDLVKIVAYVTVPGSLALYERVRSRKLGAVTPISTYVEVVGLGDPRWLVSIEGEAIQEISP